MCHRGVGGSARVAVELADELSRRGHEVHLFARSPPFGFAADGRTHQHTLSPVAAECPRLDADWSPEEMEALAALVVEVELDVLHYHYAVPFAEVAAVVQRRLGASAPAVVATLHGTDVTIFGRRRACRQAVAGCLARASAVTTVSRSHSLLAARVFGLPFPPLVIPNFIDLARFSPRPAERERSLRIAHVSNLRRVKRPAAMASIFLEVRKATDAELWLVGDGDARGALERKFSDSGASADVRFFGLRSDPEEILPDAHVLLVTSWSESFCLAVLEAASCGIPVVAPRVGGLPEVVRDGVTGILHRPGHDQAAVGALVGLARDEPWRRALGAAAREHAAKFSAATVVPWYVELYASVLDAPRVPATALAGVGVQP